MATRTALRTLQPALRWPAAPTRSVRVGAPSSSAASSLHTTAVQHAETDAAGLSNNGDPQLGDYRQPPPVSRQTRRYDPRWWDKQEKANFGETLHEQDDVLSVWAPDVHAVPARKALFQLLTAFAAFGAVAGVIYTSMPGRPSIPRTYPRDGLKDELPAGIAAPAEGDFDQKEEEEGDEDEE